MPFDEQEIKRQIAAYDEEIAGIRQYLESISNQLYMNDQERSDLGGPYMAQMAASINAREQQLRAQRDQVASRLPQLEFERRRLKAMLN